MAKLKATVNGVKLKDGDKVTLVIQATAKVTENTRFDGTMYKDVEFVSNGSEHYVDAWESDTKPGIFTAYDVTVVKR